MKISRNSLAYHGDAVNHEVVASLTRALDSADANERAQAAVRLGEIQAQTVLPKLRALTRNPEDVVALAAMYSCWLLGEDTINTGRVVEALASGDESLVQEAIQVVCQIGHPMVDKFRVVLGDTPSKAPTVLAALDDLHEPAARTIIEAFRTDDPTLLALKREILDDWDRQDDVPA